MQAASNYITAYEDVVQALLPACQSHYADNLTALAVFGSVARGRFRPDSDVDVLIVLKAVIRGARRDFEAIDARLAATLAQARRCGANPFISPVIKSEDSVTYGSPLFLDMTFPDERRILFDRERFLELRLERLALRLKELGSQRIQKGGGYYWLLKPDYRPGDVIEL